MRESPKDRRERLKKDPILWEQYLENQRKAQKKYRSKPSSKAKRAKFQREWAMRNPEKVDAINLKSRKKQIIIIKKKRSNYNIDSIKRHSRNGSLGVFMRKEVLRKIQNGKDAETIAISLNIPLSSVKAVIEYYGIKFLNGSIRF